MPSAVLDRNSPGPRVAILVEDEQLADPLRAACPAAGFAEDPEILAVTADPRATVERVRARFGSMPLGYAACSNRSAVEALAAGADEALVLTADESAVTAFLHRVRIRAERRAQREAMQRSLAHADKLAALGTVVAGVAHEINNPSAAVLLNVEMLHASLRPIGELVDEVARIAERGVGARRDEIERLGAIGARIGTAGEVEELVRDIGTAMRTITDVVRDLRVFARRAPEEEPELVDVHALVSSVLRIARGELASVAVVEQDFDPDLPPVFLPRSRLTQVLTNLLVNAAQAVREVERTAHRVRISTRHDDGGVSITITDTGPGIAFEDLERIFDPFYTTKPAGSGTGLGLSVSRELVRALGGELLVESVPGEGASFAVLLPRAAPGAREPASRRAPVVHVRRASVLLVDDDDRVLRACARVLRPRYDVLCASDGMEAMEMLESGSHADVLLCDMAMPEWGGRDLFEWLSAHRPELAGRTIFVTAGARTPEDEDFLRVTPRLVLYKPVTRAALLDAIEANLGA
jgi:signal transduction histidine kinase